MITSLKMHWRIYLMEFFGLTGFVFIAGLLTIFLEHPDMPVMRTALKNYALLRRIPLGIILGGYIMLLVLLLGKKSGAHINPAVSWTFFRLGKIKFNDAFFFTLAQFTGAITAAQIVKRTMGQLFSNPKVNYGNTEPKPPYGMFAAFTAEFIISFTMMILVLVISSSRRFEKYIATVSGVLIAFYLIIETPFSGMSLNPARSLAAAVAADKWDHIWIYFTAPTIAMLIAAEVFIVWKEQQLSAPRLIDNPDKSKLTERDYKEISSYPREKII